MEHERRLLLSGTPVIGSRTEAVVRVRSAGPFCVELEALTREGGAVSTLEGRGELCCLCCCHCCSMCICIVILGGLFIFPRRYLLILNIVFHCFHECTLGTRTWFVGGKHCTLRCTKDAETLWKWVLCCRKMLAQRLLRVPAKQVVNMCGHTC